MKNKKLKSVIKILNKNLNNLKKKFKKNKRRNNNSESLFQIKEKFYDLGKTAKKSRKKTRATSKMFQQKIEFTDLKTVFKRDSYAAYYYGLGGFLVLAIIYFLFFSSYFIIDKIIIERTDNLTNIEIAYSGIHDFYGKQILLLNKQELADSIDKFQPNLETINISRKLPNYVYVKLTSYKPEFNITLNDKQYLLLENGTLVPGGNRQDLQNLEIHMEDEETPGVLSYSQFVKEDDVVAISLLKELFEKNIEGLNVESYDYFPLEKEVHMNLDSGVKLIFDLVSDPKEQLKRLKLIMQNEAIEDFVYIDLRIEGRIFFCPKKEEHNWDNTYKCENVLKEIYNYEF